MKSNKYLLKAFCVGLIFFFCTVVSAQKQTSLKFIFLRVYNLEGKKINKGRMIFVNDSTLALNRNGNKVEIKFNNIGKIKTKRSGGHNVLIGSLAGFSLGAIGGVATSDDWLWTAEEGAYAGGILGAAGGAAIGGVTAGFKDSETYVINGDLKKWKVFQESFDIVKD